MAITINKQAASPNLANGYLVYQVTSTQIAQAQFQFVADIKYNGGALIQRVKQQPNPQGYGVFDFSRIIATQLGETDEVWKIQTAQTNTACGLEFDVIFGEEYGTSVSSSITLYTGLGPAGSPAKSGSAYYFYLDGVVNPNELSNWNWDTSNNLDYVNPTINPTGNYQNALTDFSTNTIRSTDYHTISFLNGNINGTTDLSSSAQDVYIMAVKEYNSTGSLTNTMYWYNSEDVSNGGPRATASTLWGVAYASQSQATRLIHFPAGPQNFQDDGNPVDTTTAYYDLEFYSQNTSGSIGGVLWGSYRFNVQNNCDYDGTRFAWKNQYGVWDYFNFTLAEDAQTGIERKTFNQTFLNYASNTPVTYNKARRGDLQYYNELTERYTAQSDWLTQTEADNIKELFYSTNVYIQDGTNFLPVVVINSTIEQKKNIRTQKLFRYTVEYKFANDLIARR